MSVEKYSGKEPYIFISYAHKDTNKVMPIIERLDKDGYRIWYDEGIPTAARFNDVIAERIDSCAFMLLFVSDSYIASDYCNKELNLAEQEKKKLICIYARGVNLTPRFKMLKANYQGIKEPYMCDDSFFESIRDSEDISICLKLDNANNTKRIEYENGNVYEGKIKNGERNGYGKMIYANGNTYEGEWKGNKRNGHGKNYSWLCTYEGEWKNNQEDGQGKCTLINGMVIEGEWKNGKMNGRGKCINIDGSIYEGEWKAGLPNGQGKMIYADGAIYEGSWQNSKRNGYGKIVFADNPIYSVYEGEWKNGTMNGKGKMTYVDGGVYEGEFKDGMKNGHGKMTLSDGTVIEGEWENDKFKG